VTTLALLDLAERLGALADVERSWFEITSRWAIEAADPRATRVLSTLSVHHGWRFDLLVHRLPAINGESPTRWLGRTIEPAGHGDHAHLVGDAARVEHLGTVVLPSLLARIDALGTTVDQRVDGPTHRLLTQCRHDLLGDLDAIAATR